MAQIICCCKANSCLCQDTAQAQNTTKNFKGTLLSTPDLDKAYRFFLISIELMYKFEKVNLV